LQHLLRTNFLFDGSGGAAALPVHLRQMKMGNIQVQMGHVHLVHVRAVKVKPIFAVAVLSLLLLFHHFPGHQ